MDEPRSGIGVYISCGRERRLAAGYSLIYYFFLTIFGFFSLGLAGVPVSAQTVPPSAVSPAMAAAARQSTRTGPRTSASSKRTHRIPQGDGTLYENGPVNGNTDSWTINSGFVVSDTFTLTAPASVTGLSFGAWLSPGDTLTSVDVSITSSENGGTTFFTGTVNFSQVGDCTLNGFDFNVCLETGTFPGANLANGTYWVNFQNAVSTMNIPVYWDENSGVGCQSSGCPSMASDTQEVGTIPSESFTITGSPTGQPPTCGPLSLQAANGSLAVTASVTCTDSQGGGDLSTVISWGDGNSDPPIMGGTLMATHMYSAPGLYAVNVVATDPSGLQGMANASVSFSQTQSLLAGQQTTVALHPPPGTGTLDCASAVGPNGQMIQASDFASVGITCDVVNAGADSTVTIGTTGNFGTSGALRHRRLTFAASLVLWLPLPAIVLLGSRRRLKSAGFRRYVTLGLTLILLLTLCSCGGGFTAAPLPPVQHVTPPGSYSFTVTDFQQTSLIVPLVVTGS